MAITPIHGTTGWLKTHIQAVNAGLPMLDGKVINIYRIPRPRLLELPEWLRGEAPVHVKQYGRECYKWFKANPKLKPPWGDKFLRDMDL